jgi:hypothetical protein
MPENAPYVEHPCPDDEEHRAMRRLGLTVTTCEGRGCNNLRDLALIARARFGYEDEPRWGGGPDVLAAMDRVNTRPHAR